MFNRSPSIRSKTTGLSVILILALCATSSCGSSKRLDRSKASDLIKQSPQFSRPYEVIVRHQRDERHLDPVDPNETRQQGEARAVQEFYNSSPYRAVLRHLGLIEAKAAYQSTRMYGEKEGSSLYALDVRLTSQGEQMWHDLNLQVDPASLPLGRREIVDVTGVTGGDGQRERTASAEFTWRWTLTMAGASMTRGTPEFENLPDDVKRLFDDDSTRPISRAPLELSGTRRGHAQFQLFDDGWRLVSVEPSEPRPLNPID